MDHEDSDKQQQGGQGANKSGSFKAKVGFFFGYNGQKFKGMQYQRQHGNTIQNTIHALLLQNGFMLKSNANQLKRIRWSRAARTDKKVHALCNGISVRLEIGQKYAAEPGSRQINYNRIICDLNDQLPMDIKIHAMRRVGKSFDMRHDAKTRIYNYIIPSKLFQLYAKFKQGHPIQGQDLARTIQKLNELVKFYLGTHNYFNFTRGYKQTDPRCDRFMIKMFAEKVEQQTVKTILRECGQNENQQYQSFIRFTLVGQSFIYHQIRKMIGLLIKIFSQELDGQQTIKKAFKPQQFDGYLAPGQGLYLNRMTFQSYNNRKDTKQRIQFTQQEQQRITKYRAYLQTKIIKHQVQEKVFTNWLINRTDYDKKQEQQNQEAESEESNNNGNKKKEKFQKNNKKNNGKFTKKQQKEQIVKEKEKDEIKNQQKQESIAKQKEEVKEQKAVIKPQQKGE